MDLHWEIIFKTGTHTDSSGTTLTFDADKLKAMETMYNEQPEEQKHTAPLVLGHPEDDASSPAYGWVEKLKAVGDKLYAGISGISQELKEMVKEGLYKTKSAAFYPNGLLRHVGILGATPPAVKGMPNLGFAALGSDYADYPISDVGQPSAEALPKHLVEILNRSAKYGISVKRLYEYVAPSSQRGLTEDDYADPVNLYYPINDKPNLIASYQEVRYGYSYEPNEAQIVKARLYAKAKELGVPMNEHGELILTYSESNSSQAKRAASYGIEAKEGLRSSKPSQYEGLNDGQFADPVHYRFPLTAETIKGSLATWNRSDIQKHYNEKEKAIISKRLIEFARGNNINLTDYTWAYGELEGIYYGLASNGKFIELRECMKNLYDPIKTKSLAYGDGVSPNSPKVLVSADKLTNKQLLEVLGDLVNNNNNTKQFEEGIMKTMTVEQFDAFVADLLAKIGETYQEETVGQISGIVDTLKSDAKYWTEQPEDAAAPAEPTSEPAFGEATKKLIDVEIDKVRREYSEKLAVLEAKDRLNDYNKYCDEQEKAGRTLPKQRNLVITVLDAVRNINGVKFSEGGKTTDKNAQELVRKLIESFPTQVEYGQLYNQSSAAASAGTFTMPAGKTKAEAEDSFGNLFAEMQNVISEYAAAGKTLKESEALSIARQKLNL